MSLDQKRDNEIIDRDIMVGGDVMVGGDYVNVTSVGWSAPDEINEAQDLLGEYSVKLREMTTLYQQKIQNFTLILPLLLLAMLLIMIATFAFLGEFTNGNRLSVSDGNLFATFIGLTITITAIAIPLFYYTRTRAYLKSLNEEIFIAKSQLAKVVRVASQVEDHVAHTPSVRLKLQLRLTESESAMRLADDVLGTRNSHPYQEPDIQIKPRSSYSDLTASSNAS